MIKYNDLLNLDKTIAKELFLKCERETNIMDRVDGNIIKMGNQMII